jgi:hypothetical protein
MLGVEKSIYRFSDRFLEFRIQNAEVRIQPGRRWLLPFLISAAEVTL